MRYFYLLAISLLLVACGASDEKNGQAEEGEEAKDILELLEETLPVKNTDITQEMLDKFVPEGYKIVQWQLGNLNMDDKNGLVMLQNTVAKTHTYALKNYADYRAQILENQLNGLLLKIALFLTLAVTFTPILLFNLSTSLVLYFTISCNTDEHFGRPNNDEI